MSDTGNRRIATLVDEHGAPLFKVAPFAERQLNQPQLTIDGQHVPVLSAADTDAELMGRAHGSVGGFADLQQTQDALVSAAHNAIRDNSNPVTINEAMDRLNIGGGLNPADLCALVATLMANVLVRIPDYERPNVMAGIASLAVKMMEDAEAPPDAMEVATGLARA